MEKLFKKLTIKEISLLLSCVILTFSNKVGIEK